MPLPSLFGDDRSLVVRIIQSHLPFIVVNCIATRRTLICCCSMEARTSRVFAAKLLFSMHKRGILLLTFEKFSISRVAGDE